MADYYSNSAFVIEATPAQSEVLLGKVRTSP